MRSHVIIIYKKFLNNINKKAVQWVQVFSYLQFVTWNVADLAQYLSMHMLYDRVIIRALDPDSLNQDPDRDPDPACEVNPDLDTDPDPDPRIQILDDKN
jgi:hypothetical protein